MYLMSFIEEFRSLFLAQIFMLGYEITTNSPDFRPTAKSSPDVSNATEQAGPIGNLDTRAYIQNIELFIVFKLSNE